MDQTFEVVTAQRHSSHQAFRPWVEYLVTASETDLCIHDFATGSVRLQIEFSEGVRANMIVRIVMDDSGPILILGYDNGHITMFSWSADKELFEFVEVVCAHDGAMKSMVFNRKSQRLLTMGGDTLRVWSVDRAGLKPVTELIHGAVDGDSIKLLFFEDGEGVVIIQISKGVRTASCYSVVPWELRAKLATNTQYSDANVQCWEAFRATIPSLCVNDSWAILLLKDVDQRGDNNEELGRAPEPFLFGVPALHYVGLIAAAFIINVTTDLISHAIYGQW